MTTTANTLTPLPVISPNLPLPPPSYSSIYQNDLTNVLRLYQDRVATVLNANSISLSYVFGGTATFVAATTVAVSLGKTMPNTSYYIGLSGNAAGFCWCTNKTRTGFTINCSASNSNTTDWIII